MYKIYFHRKAFKEWNKLDVTIKNRFEKKLTEIKNSPKIPSKELRSPLENCYKIKVQNFRLVYEVVDSKLIIKVICIAKRENSKVYALASERL